VTPNAPQPPVRLLALGDSYTIGEAVEPDERWPLRLAAMLRARGVDVAPPTIVARTGWTTDELSSGIDGAGLGGAYDLVTLLIGVNNQYRGRTADEFRQRFGPLLGRALGFTSHRASRVIVVSIPDWGVTPFGRDRNRTRISAEIDLFNETVRDQAMQVGAAFIDVTPISRRAASEPELLAPDGLHPSGAMYAEWARVILPIAANALA
jgi:lysophospholipase L1-like esterase